MCVSCQLVCNHVSHLLCLLSCFKMIWTQPSNDRLHTHRTFDSTTINQGPVIGDIPRIICTKSHLLAALLKDARCLFDPKFVSIDRYFGIQMRSDDLCNRMSDGSDVGEMDFDWFLDVDYWCNTSLVMGFIAQEHGWTWVRWCHYSEICDVIGWLRGKWIVRNAWLSRTLDLPKEYK